MISERISGDCGSDSPLLTVVVDLKQLYVTDWKIKKTKYSWLRKQSNWRHHVDRMQTSIHIFL